MRDHYVYGLYEPDEPLPRYIGLDKNYRILASARRLNKPGWMAVLPRKLL